MRLLFLSKFGDGADIAFRVKQDLNEVRLWIKDPGYQDVADGMVPKVKDWRGSFQWADVVVFDSNGMSDIWRQIHNVKPCFGGSVLADKLEKDRKFGHQMMKEIGLQTAECGEYRTVQQAIAHVTSHKVKHVVKPFGGKVESHHIILSHYESGEDVVALLERFKNQGIPYDGVVVERKIGGIEAGVGMFSDGLHWIGYPEINFEHKQAYPDLDPYHSVGYLTGEMGTLLKFVTDENHPTFVKCLKPLDRFFRTHTYKGQIDINMKCQTDPETGEPVFYGLEWTSRLGYPASYIIDEVLITPWAELFSGIAYSRPFKFQVHHDWAVGVQVCSFGFPSEREYRQTSLGIPIFGVEKEDQKHVHYVQMKAQGGRIVTAGGNGLAYCTTGRGATIEKAREAAYFPLKEHIRNTTGFYRNDIGKKILGRMDDVVDELGILKKEDVEVQDMAEVMEK